MNACKYDPASIRRAFQFLIDEFGYTVSRDEELFHDIRPYAFVIEYVGNERRINLSHDYRDNFFDFKLIRRLNTQFSNDSDLQNVVPFIKIFRIFEPSLDLKSVQPQDKSCAEAALVNAQLLKKYASKVLQGKEWI